MQRPRIVSPAPRQAWQAVLDADPNALVSQTPAWVDCVCAADGYVDASRLYAWADGHSVILPMMRQRILPRLLASSASPPYGWGFGGVLSDSPLRAEDVSAVFDDLSHGPALQFGIRPNPLLGSVWAAVAPASAVAVPRSAHVLDLAGGFEQVWAHRFSSDTRRKIRKAEQAGLKVERDADGSLVPVFYELFSQSLERWAEQQHEPNWLARWRGRQRDPLRKFVMMREALGEAFRLWVAWHDGRPAAAILVLQGKNAHYTRGAMDKDLAGPTYANYLLHRRAIEDACAAGCHYYHMGETGESASLAQFKKHFGAVAYPYSEYHVERLPLTRLDKRLRSVVKQIIGFRDT